MGQEDKKTTWNLLAKQLAGEASPEEIQELERLLKNNPEWHYPMQTISDLWKSSGKPDNEAAETAFLRHLDRMKEQQIDFPAIPAETAIPDNPVPGHLKTGSHALRRALVLTLTACAGLLIAVIWSSHRTPNAPVPATVARQPAADNNEIQTANGTKTHLKLPDGTRVWLNAGSRLTYSKNFNSQGREVNLTGEAFFDVARNSQKPFLIHTAKIDIKVLGTSFNVKSYPTDKTTEATLIRGSIEVSINDRPNEKIILKPNEKLVVANDDSMMYRINPGKDPAGPTGDQPMITILKPTYLRSAGAIVETSWVDNKLAFREEKFGDLVRQMERWYGITIRFDDSALEELQFTGSFKEETVRQALDALRLTAPFTYKIEGNQITIDK